MKSLTHCSYGYLHMVRPTRSLDMPLDSINWTQVEKKVLGNEYVGKYLGQVEGEVGVTRIKICYFMCGIVKQ